MEGRISEEMEKMMEEMEREERGIGREDERGGKEREVNEAHGGGIFEGIQRRVLEGMERWKKGKGTM